MLLAVLVSLEGMRDGLLFGDSGHQGYNQDHLPSLGRERTEGPERAEPVNEDRMWAWS